MITHVFTDNFLSKNAFLPQKFENKNPLNTFLMKTIPSVFDEVKLAANELKIPNLLIHIRDEYISN